MTHPKSILITGAGRGLGLALAQEFHSRNWRVFPLVRNERDVQTLQTKFGDDVIQADVATPESANIVQNRLRQLNAQIDVLINNAGIPGKGKSIVDLNPDETASLLQTHCLGAMRCVQAVLPFFNQGQERLIVNISSRRGSIDWQIEQRFKNKVSYSYRIAKAAQNMLTACLTEELTPLGFKIVAIHPGALFTQVHRPPDASVSPEDAARRLADLVETPSSLKSGTFFEPETGEIPW